MAPGKLPPNLDAEDLSSLCANTFNVTATDASGCTALASYSITEPAPLIISIDSIGNEINGQGNGFADISISGGTPPFNFGWFLNNQLVSNQEDSSGLSAGSYLLSLQDANTCEDAIFISIDNLTATYESANTSAFKVFPNPTSSTLYIQAVGSTHLVQIRMYRSNGVLLRSEKPNAAFTRIDIAAFPAGNYILLMIDEKGNSHPAAFTKI